MSSFSVRNVLAVIALAISLSGCVTSSKVQDVMQSWVGKHQSELIQVWGPPQQTTSDGKGGTILVYSNYVDLGQAPGQAASDYWGNVTYTAPEQRGYQRTRLFYVDPKGYVYFWRWEGL